MDNIDKIRGLNSKIIVGIETGNIPEHPAAIAAEVKGHGDSTVFKLLYYAKRSFPEDLQKMLEGAAEGNDFDGEEAASINFLVLHHLASLYGELLDEADLKNEDIHLVGLKCMELGGNLFPNDPAVLSGMIDRIVASHFTIDVDGRRELLPVGELILKELVTEMIDKFELGDEAREAVGVALLANESLYYEKVGMSQKDGVGPEELSPGVNISRGVEGGEGDRKTVLNGRFFFPY
jgi:hypothetical protein